VCCVDGGNAFDAANRRFVRFPGGSLGHGYQWSRQVKLKESPAWIYDPAANTWTNMRPPPYGQPEKYSRQTVGGLNSGAVYDPNHELVLTFGGQSSGGGKNALFAYDVYANTLHALEAANPPEPRDGMGLAYDAGHDKLVMFGSQYLPDEKTWLYDLRTGRWQSHELSPHPPAHKVTKDYCSIPRMAYDPLHGVVLCIAWLGEQGHETWALDVGKLRWTKLSPAVEPAGSKSRSRNLDFDRQRNVFVLETSSAKTNRPEIWTYRYRAAGKADLASRPSPPGDLQVLTEEGGQARLTWKADASGSVARYDIYRATADKAWEAEFTRIGSSMSGEFTDDKVEKEKIHFYTVKSVGKDGAESPPGNRARTQPRVLLQPIVSVLDKNQVRVVWERHPAADVAGYNVYRGLAKVRTVSKGTPAAWRDNDPQYAEPLPVEVRDIVRLHKLNQHLLTETTLSDTVDLTARVPESEDYKFAVYAYVVRAVNRLGVDSGPSPYALTIPSEPLNLFCREDGEFAELKWDASREQGLAGYHVYRLVDTWSLARVTDQPVTETVFRYRVGKGQTRFWIVPVDALGQEGQPSSPVWFNRSYRGFFTGQWHQ
jgi:hypothetical protein